ncbi:Cysteine protease atg4d [Balamuthia mandrillaris]
MLGRCYKKDDDQVITPPRPRRSGNEQKEGEKDKEEGIRPTVPFPAFLKDFFSRLWFTYRKDFHRIEPSPFTSDVGWGCTLRSGQMLLAQALSSQLLGREWRLDPLEPPPKHYAQILRLFGDHPLCPFSIHNIAQNGLKFGKNVGEWFGPSTIAQVLEEVVQENNPTNLAVYVSTDGCLYKDQITERCLQSTGNEGNKEEQEEQEEKQWRPLLLIIPLRLGLDSLNQVYVPALKHTFHFPQSLGIVGGKPRSSLYFVGYQDNDLFYFDPHTIQPTDPLLFPSSSSPSSPAAAAQCEKGKEKKENAGEDAKEEQLVEFLASYHCAIPHRLAIRDIDPSLALAFFCPTLESFDDFCQRSRQMNKELMTMYEIADETPHYLKKERTKVHHAEKFFSDDEDDEIVFL